MAEKRAFTVVAVLAVAGVFLPCPDAEAAYARHPGWHGQARLARATDVDCDGIVGATDLIRVRNAFHAAPAGDIPENVCGGATSAIDTADLACVRADLGLGVDAYTTPTGPQGGTNGRARPDKAFSLHGLTYDHATGLVLARARYYHPTLGRWTQRDPTGYADGGNLYEAFGSNPVRYTDPMGEDINTDDPGVAAWVAGRIQRRMPEGSVSLTYRDPKYAFLDRLKGREYCGGWTIRLSLSQDDIEFLLNNPDWPFDPTDNDNTDRVLALLAAMDGNHPAPSNADVLSYERQLFWRRVESTVFSERVMSRVSGTSRVAGAVVVGAASLMGEGASGFLATPLAFLGAAWSGDQLGTGLAEIWSGEYHATLGQAGIEHTVGDGTAGQVATFVYDVAPCGGVAVRGPRISGASPRAARAFSAEELGYVRARIRELGMDPVQGFVRREGIGGYRIERALCRAISRSPDPAADFLDDLLGPISLKGPLPSGARDVVGLARSAIEDAIGNTYTKVLFVDLRGLSATERATVQSIVRFGASGASKSIFFLE